MSKLILYHGSSEIIKQPAYGKGKAYNDYGLGFYMTENIELAKEWACSERADGYANIYEVDTASLKILNLTDSNYTILNWLAILMDNRILRSSSPIADKGKDYLKKYFLPDYKKYDAIVGYRADDSYFSFARAFLMNEISIKQLSYAMNLGRLGEQFVLKSKKAFAQIKFKGYEIADGSIYYSRRKVRDEEARGSYQLELANDDIDGVFMRDILREEMKCTYQMQ